MGSAKRSRKGAVTSKLPLFGICPHDAVCLSVLLVLTNLYHGLLSWNRRTIADATLENKG
jgi:hypothetical protein